MSDFSGMEHSFALPSATAELQGGLADLRQRSYDVKLEEIEFRRLHAADELQAIHKLRSEIQLPGKALADPGFLTREKKETAKGW
ncbi:hypothetical protein H8N03_25245 [Ramlibacter sp. USB13]|uniref:Uncharacterized protein n=1 Tax=Ramlibacter cellulosilyticus TaxID=2764187 RepID=A0A923SEG8_9BURK|nr:hypothetical protein [Ramlibacter cellulosilyticus]MBC5786268.1 hypothetical protein [Ramlibacter cellulosilyticus]